MLGRLLPALTLLAACGGGASPAVVDGADDGYDRAALLAHLATDVLLPMQEAAATALAALPPAVEAYCDALDAGGEVAAPRAAAQAAWRDAIGAWQRADAVLVGPAAMDERALRDRLYAWPLFGSCTVDRDTATSWADPGGYDVGLVLNNARSLTAVEYLLFRDTAGHTCPTVPPGWDALGADLPRARCRQAQAIAADVAAQGEALATAWRAGQGDYVGELATAGAAGSSIPSAHEGLNLVTDGLISYVDRMIKSMKLGEAAGIEANACGAIQEPCLLEVEHRYADHGTAAIRANLAAVHAAFTGDAAVAGPGFDDYLSAVGAEALAMMVAGLDCDRGGVPDSLLTALDTDLPAIGAAHAAVKAFSDDLKSQFLTVLARLDIPDDVATDNDLIASGSRPCRWCWRSPAARPRRAARARRGAPGHRRVERRRRRGRRREPRGRGGDHRRRRPAADGRRRQRCHRGAQLRAHRGRRNAHQALARIATGSTSATRMATACARTSACAAPPRGAAPRSRCTRTC
ncbi:MAG: imelysin family protein [Kofleriaceae bacterium]